MTSDAVEYRDVGITTQTVSKKARGVRLRPRHQEEIRAKIQTVQILKVIQDHILTGTEIASTRISAGLKLLDKVLPNAIPEAIEANNQAQALQAIQQAQLMAMAQEMLRQGNTIEGQHLVETDKDALLLPSESKGSVRVITDLPEEMDEVGIQIGEGVGQGWGGVSDGDNS